MLPPQNRCPGTQASPEQNPQDPPGATGGPEDTTGSQSSRSYSLKAKEFILEPISEALVRVTFRQQQGYFGMALKWNPQKPYAWSTWSPKYTTPNPEGLEMTFHRATSPDEALEQLCNQLLQDQQQADAASINPEQRKKAARQVLQDLLQELPQTGTTPLSPEPPDLSQTSTQPVPPQRGHRTSITQSHAGPGVSLHNPNTPFQTDLEEIIHAFTMEGMPVAQANPGDDGITLFTPPHPRRN